MILEPGKNDKESDNVSRRILEDAADEKKKIIQDAQNKAKEIIDSAEQKRKNLLEKAKLDAKAIYKRVYELEIAKAKSAARQDILLEKIRIVDETIQMAEAALKNSDGGMYLNILKEILKGIDTVSAEYVIGKKDNVFTSAMIQKIPEGKMLKESKKESDFDNGLKIIEGKKEYIISAETLVKDKIDDIRMEIAEFLFDKE